VAASAKVFVQHGFRRTQVQDVADALDLSMGSLYGYAAGKYALFAAALRYADGTEPLPGRDALPVPAPSSGDLAALVRARLAGELETLELLQALARPGPPPGMSGPQEFGAVLADLYRRLTKHRTAIKLVDRCAADFPELHTVWFAEGRSAQMDGLTQYLQRRAETGLLTVPGRVDVVARSAIELCVLWAVHRHWDPAPRPHSLAAGSDAGEDDPADTVVHLLTRVVHLLTRVVHLLTWVVHLLTRVVHLLTTRIP
jgi:AcrR family transcriptional regulator